MNLEDFKDRMTNEVNRWAQSSGSLSRAFQKWFLVNYFRIDEDEGADFVCDNPNDKGIDGIYTDDLSGEAFVFQCKYSETAGIGQGDSDLRNFAGVKAWFESPINIENLDDSLANQELKAIIHRLELLDKIEQGYKVNLVFVTNKIFDANAREYLGVVGDYFDAWDLNRLFDTYTYAGKDKPVRGKFSFSVEKGNIIYQDIPHDTQVLVFPAKATDIVKLEGIQDGSLFDKNVRYGLGKTRINREIAKTLQASSEHDRFFLYNNGITIICENVKLNDKELQIENYAVVNGCQTVLTLYENKDNFDDHVKVLVRIIRTGADEALSERITYYNNNQNAISTRDLKSRDKVQQDIQKQFFDYFDNKMLYNIKKGEPEQGYDIVIRNDFAAQLIASFVLKEPYTAHQKTQTFTENYYRIFSRHVSPPLIFLLYEMYRNIDKNCASIENAGARDYKTTRFFFIYLFKEIFEEDESGSKLLSDADSFYQTYKGRYEVSFDKLSQMLVLDFNNYVADQEENNQYFDYKNILRNAQMTQKMARQIITDYKKGLIHHPEERFSKLLS